MSERIIHNIQAGVSEILKKLDEVPVGVQVANKVSELNSSSTPLLAGATFTGEWEDVSLFNSVVMALETDKRTEYYLQFSPDKVNIDSSLIRYHKENEIHAPHRFTITRKYCRVIATNVNGEDQTFFRLQVSYGDKAPLNAPLDGTVAQDFDATLVRPTDFEDEVELGIRQGVTNNKRYGYNLDVDSAAPEVVASFGGTFFPETTPGTFTITYNQTVDGLGTTGALSLYMDYIDSNKISQVGIHTLGNDGSDVTSFSGYGINRCFVLTNGGNRVNNANIDIVATGTGNTQARIPAGNAVTQQCIHHVASNSRAIAKKIRINIVRLAGGGVPKVTIVGKFYNYSTNAVYSFFRESIDTALSNQIPIYELDYPIYGHGVIWFELTTDTDNTQINMRLTTREYKLVNA